jgi:hypothetical protein
MPQHTETKQYQTYAPALADEGQRSEAVESISSQAQYLGERVEHYAAEVASTAREHPYTALAIAAGLAFAVGALWKIRSTPQRTYLEELTARLPELPNRKRLLPRGWL